MRDLTTSGSPPYDLVPVISRSWRLRGARLMLTFFALFWAESFVLPSCPMHQAVEEHGSHGGHQDAPAPGPGGCACLGSCVSSGSLGMPGRAVALESGAAPVARPPVAAPPGAPPAVDQLHLPDAQGPPALA